MQQRSFPRRSLGAIVLGLALSALIGGCASTSTASIQPSQPATANSAGTPGGSGGQSCNEPCVLFNLTVNFTGLDTIQGSFVDNSTGTGYNSCAEFASGDSVGFVPGPGTPSQGPQIDGKILTFLFVVGHDKFHGAGTYTNTLVGGVTIGSDTFLGTGSTETLNADGSGQATFSNLPGGSNPSQGMESGTVIWTCSK